MSSANINSVNRKYYLQPWGRRPRAAWSRTRWGRRPAVQYIITVQYIAVQYSTVQTQARMQYSTGEGRLPRLVVSVSRSQPMMSSIRCDARISRTDTQHRSTIKLWNNGGKEVPRLDLTSSTTPWQKIHKFDHTRTANPCDWLPCRCAALPLVGCPHSLVYLHLPVDEGLIFCISATPHLDLLPIIPCFLYCA